MGEESGNNRHHEKGVQECPDESEKRAMVTQFQLEVDQTGQRETVVHYFSDVVF